MEANKVRYTSNFSILVCVVRKLKGYHLTHLHKKIIYKFTSLFPWDFFNYAEQCLKWILTMKYILLKYLHPIKSKRTYIFTTFRLKRIL